MTAPLQPVRIAGFVERRADAFYGVLADTNMIFSGLLAAFIAAVAPFNAEPANVRLIVVANALLVVATLAYFSLKKRFARGVRWYVLACNLAYAAVFAWVLRRGIERGWDASLAVPLCTLLSVDVFLIFGAPVAPKPRVALTAAYLALAYYATSADWAVHFRSAVIVTVALVSTCTLSILVTGLTREQAERDVLQLLSIAPAELVRRSLEAGGASIAELLKPKDRRVVTLASDWRGFQLLAKAMSPERLSRTLERYYEGGRELLAERFGARPFHVDWIADELLVHFVVERPEEEGRICADALAFARDLLAMKRRFNAEEGLAVGVDVGLTLSVAAVGLLGPASHRKVMAVGPAVVRARRLQAVAKGLRRGRGSPDRIVWDEAFAKALGGVAGEPLETVALAPGLAPEPLSGEEVT